jgi:hypothetical protein
MSDSVGRKILSVCSETTDEIVRPAMPPNLRLPPRADEAVK